MMRQESTEDNQSASCAGIKGEARKPDKKEIAMIDGIGVFQGLVPKGRVPGMVRWAVTFFIGIGVSEALPDTPAVINIFAVWLAGNLIRHFCKRSKRYRTLAQNVIVRDITVDSIGCPLDGESLYHVKYTVPGGAQQETDIRVGCPKLLFTPGTKALLAVYRESETAVIPAHEAYAGYLREVDTYYNA